MNENIIMKNIINFLDKYLTTKTPIFNFDTKYINFIMDTEYFDKDFMFQNDCLNITCNNGIFYFIEKNIPVNYVIMPCFQYKTATNYLEYYKNNEIKYDFQIFFLFKQKKEIHINSINSITDLKYKYVKDNHLYGYLKSINIEITTSIRSLIYFIKSNYIVKINGFTFSLIDIPYHSELYYKYTKDLMFKIKGGVNNLELFRKPNSIFQDRFILYYLLKKYPKNIIIKNEIKDLLFDIYSKDKCIFTCCTLDYLNRAFCLYNSLREQDKDIYFYVKLINIQTKENLFRKINDDKLFFEYDNINIHSEIKIKAYSSCCRANMFNYLIYRFKYLYWMDADTIIRKNINILFDKLNDTDIVIYKNPSSETFNFKKFGHFKTGIIGIKNDMINFTFKWDNLIFSKGIDNCFWYQDQQTISKILLKNKYKIYELEKEFIDWDFNNDSYIWVGKGKRKNDDIYLEEENKYINI